MVRLQRFNATGTTCPICGHESVFDGKCEMTNCEEMGITRGRPNTIKVDGVRTQRNEWDRVVSDVTKAWKLYPETMKALYELHNAKPLSQSDNVERKAFSKEVLDEIRAFVKSDNDRLQGYRESFAGYSTQDLFHEILSLSKGDQWDGMSSKNNDADLAAAMKIFGERMQAAGIEWDGEPTQEQTEKQLNVDFTILGLKVYTVGKTGNKIRIDPTTLVINYNNRKNR